ncbi:hypothetical protein GLOTRDRAFT_111614 [Gloeophyllum trabeum ATCC 11539]|uniref:Uncharacterized protein n=1 Tax=Gloeophyllum trabeum (strain ATCC 11539 / FP-39264 / Madison 617) TaxID=670483 RepID=S7Q487_GLOTA|nr:uncharacterized protein GLOTRDRAFT_111614 [Gloeophyllum trabeum ATCC 11539]EPQ54283.1 hypothetical protein GLOTRDRAFT_111614 [Gloeophyllum trabeum ATCC 11539]
MSSARALLKAKRQEARVSHPLASYNASGQLRCIACGSIVKYASAWDGHIGSKAHRTNVAKLKEAERLKEEQRLREEEEKARGKRKAEDDENGEENGTETKKRRVNEDGDEEMGSPPATESKPSKNGFPADFFSDPSQAPALGGHDEDEDEQPAAPPQPQNPIDLEWEAFQKTVLAAPDPQADLRERFENATIVAEPEPASDIPEGFPPLAGQEPAGAAVVTEALDEEAIRKRKEIEDRELIMDRLLDEERAQEEADEKVNALKARLDAIKKRREAAKAAKAKTG